MGKRIFFLVPVLATKRGASARFFKTVNSLLDSKVFLKLLRRILLQEVMYIQPVCYLKVFNCFCMVRVVEI